MLKLALILLLCSVMICKKIKPGDKVLNVHSVTAERDKFEDFITQFHKKYSSVEEKEKRFQIFQKNLKKIEVMKSIEKGTAIHGITPFTDLTEEEFGKTKLGYRSKEANSLPKANILSATLPESFDWRHYGAVSGVKDQGLCSSCWAFSTTGNVEGQWAIKKKSLISLSEQELMDCDDIDHGCEGGNPVNAYKEIIQLGGLEAEQDYPYERKSGECRLKPNKIKVYINGSVGISSNETKMAMWLVRNGPISIGMNSVTLQYYISGVQRVDDFMCDPQHLDHGVLIVGYGVDNSDVSKGPQPYWIVKNSWGPSWGEKGYFRIYRGIGACGLNTAATSAVVL